MSMREEFEKWYRDTYWDFKYKGANFAPFNADENKYGHLDVQLAWASFQQGILAGAKAMQEQAAKVCDEIEPDGDGRLYRRDYVVAIRAINPESLGGV